MRINSMLPLPIMTMVLCFFLTTLYGCSLNVATGNSQVSSSVEASPPSGKVHSGVQPNEAETKIEPETGTSDEDTWYTK